jgi:hypothetical protein
MHDISPRKAALVAGFSILGMAIFAGFAYGYVIQNLYIPNEATSTANNIRSSQMLFRFGITCFVIVVILDLFAAWALYIFLKSVNQSLSLLTAWFRLIYSAVFGFSLLQLLMVSVLLTETNSFPALEKLQIDSLVTLFFKAFQYSWAIGLILFGFHLLFLGYLAFNSGYVPKVFGVLLVMASLCYLTSNFASIIFPGYEKYKANVEAILSLPMVIGELGFGLWLLFKGGRTSSNKSIDIPPAEDSTNVQLAQIHQLNKPLL